jgi:hypothetical protein
MLAFQGSTFNTNIVEKEEGGERRGGVEEMKRKWRSKI